MRISDWSSDVCSSDLSHHRAALDGVGVALGRVTRARLLLDSGQLVMLTKQRLKARYSHWLVYPPAAATHRGLQAFRTWLHEEAAEQVRHTEGQGRPGRGRTQDRVTPRNTGTGRARHTT